MGQESEGGLAGGLWFKFSHEMAVKLLAKDVVLSEGLTRTEGSNSKITHVVVGLKTLVPCLDTWVSP